MPKINVYLPDDLAAAVRDAGIPVSSVCQQALADAVAAADGVAATPLPTVGGAGAEDQLARLTAKARGVIEHARASAAESGREATAVHIVGGIVGEDTNLAVTVLRALDIDPADVITELRGLVRSRAADRPKPGTLEDTLRRAGQQSIELGHNFIGCEHLLLGVTAGGPDELAAAALVRLGADHATVRRAVTTALAGVRYSRQNLTFSGLSAPIRSVLEEIRTRLVRLENNQ